jgi:hypothetical protein
MLKEAGPVLYNTAALSPVNLRLVLPPNPTPVNILLTTDLHVPTKIAMQFFATIALILAAASSVIAAALPTPSGAPTCSYNCPGSDKKDWQLVGSHSMTSTTMRCDYSLIGGLDIATTTCMYDTQVSGPILCAAM